MVQEVGGQLSLNHEDLGSHPLQKEEKAHDERMNDSNARIKQAGPSHHPSLCAFLIFVLQVKRMKKSPRKGPRMRATNMCVTSIFSAPLVPKCPRRNSKSVIRTPSFDARAHLGSPSNHALYVTQQNTLVTFNVAASLARIADAEWTRICECMRRISPTIGSLGEWRSLCEGAWTGPLPDDLPEASSETRALIAPAISEWGQTGLSTPVRRSLPVPPATSYSPGSVSVSAASWLDPPRSPFTAADQNQNHGSVNSITTLSAFPFPPTHFPVPLAMNEAELQRQQAQLLSLQAVHSRAGSPNASQSQGGLPPPAPTLSDSAAAADLPELLAPDVSQPSSLQMSQTSSTPPQSYHDIREPPSTEPLTLSPEMNDVIKPITSGGDSKKPRRPSLIARVPPPSDKLIRPIPPFKRTEHSSTETEFGVHTDSSASTFKSHSVDAAKKTLERTESTRSAGNSVAALRSRYTRTVGGSDRYHPLHIHNFFPPRLKPRHKDQKMFLGCR